MKYSFDESAYLEKLEFVIEFIKFIPNLKRRKSNTGEMMKRPEVWGHRWFSETPVSLKLGNDGPE